jgi:hypothetical protein
MARAVNMRGRAQVTKTVRIGCGQGFWGDDIDAPLRLVSTGQLDYLVMDFLAEITMSILQKQKSRDPDSGYARDIIDILKRVAPEALVRGTRIVTNAGGVNPVKCGEDVVTMLESIGLGDQLKVAVITGDDLMPILDSTSAVEPLTNLETGADFSLVKDRLLSANAYIGSGPIVEALRAGADIVLCGRSTDTALTLAPLMFEFGWAEDDWDRLASGIVAGHLLECSGQVTGGNHQAGWKAVENLDEVGYPIVEVEESGSFILTKPDGSGGLVSVETATEQLLYEIGDPAAVLTPDVTVDWTSFTVRSAGKDRVAVAGVCGGPPPEKLKVSMSYSDGFMTSLLWPYAWPDAREKAEAALRKIAHRVTSLGLDVETRADVIGVSAIHGRRAVGVVQEPPEVVARFAARSQSRPAIERIAIEMAPMLFGPPGQAGFIAGGRGRVSSVVSYWPTLIARSLVETRVQLIDHPSASTAERAEVGERR